MDESPAAAAMVQLKVRPLRDGDELTAAMRLMDLEVLQHCPTDDTNWMVAGELPGIDFATTSLGPNTTRGATRPSRLTLHLDLGSDVDRRISGVELRGDDVVVAFGATEFEALARGRHRAASFSLPADAALHALQQRAGGWFELRPGRLHRFSGAGDRLGAVRTFFSALLDEDGGRLAHGRLSEFASSTMVDAALGAFLGPWAAGRDARVEGRLYQRRPIVRRAEEFMRANLGEPVTLHQICAAARASERAVEYAFRDMYGMGAKQYFKLLRLHRVRRELKTPPLNGVSISEIAHRHGFWHMGHFSSDYRRLFGETAGQTRRLPPDKVRIAAGPPPRHLGP